MRRFIWVLCIVILCRLQDHSAHARPQSNETLAVRIPQTNQTSTTSNNTIGELSMRKGKWITQRTDPEKNLRWIANSQEEIRVTLKISI